MYWRHRGRVAYADREALFDRYDCGGRMIDEITGGQVAALTAEIEMCVNKIKALY